MSIFSKAVSQLVSADLDELVRDGAVENVRLEFKSEVPDKDETLKKLSSFGNTFGGFTVIGAKAKSTDGRIESLPGVDAVSGYKQKIVDWCFSGVNPPLTVEVSDAIPAPAIAGKVCYVIYAPESDVAPHFINGRKGVWVRTDEFSARFEARLADESELRHLLDRRRLVVEHRAALLQRAKRRFEDFSLYSHKALGPLLEFCVTPRFPARPLCEQLSLQPMIENNRVQWRGISFPISGSTTIAQHESAVVINALGQYSSFECNIWGMLFYCATVNSASPNQAPVIHLYDFIGRILLFIRHAGFMLRTFGYSGPVELEINLSAIRRALWEYSSGMLHQGSELDDDLSVAIGASAETLSGDPDKILRDILQYVFFAVNWTEMVQGQRMEALVQSGYDVNQWRRA